MKRNLAFLLLAAIGGAVVCGCNVGMQPTGPSADEINAIRAKWPPEKQIDDINHSPMTPAQKKQRIAEIRAKYHLPADDSAAATTNTPPGAPPKK